MGCRGVGCGRVLEGVDGERDDRGERGGFGCGGDMFAGGGDVGNVGGVGRHDGGDIGGGGDGIGGGGDGIGGGVGIGGALLCLLELRFITPSKQACAARGCGSGGGVFGSCGGCCDGGCWANAVLACW